MSDITLLEEIADQELDKFYGGAAIVTTALMTGADTAIIMRIPKMVSQAPLESCEVKYLWYLNYGVKYCNFVIQDLMLYL